MTQKISSNQYILLSKLACVRGGLSRAKSSENMKIEYTKKDFQT